MRRSAKLTVHPSSNGGNFEFLPVTIQSGDIVLTGLLRISVKFGIEVDTKAINAKFPYEVSSGIEVGVFADVAQFVTNVTAAPHDEECALQVVEEYTMLLGANAGASIAVDDHSYGPAPSTQIPIWYTTLASACAASKTVSTVAAPTAAANATAMRRRDDGGDGFTTTTTEVTYTATLCKSTGMLNCPVSLQSTTRHSVTTTLVGTVPTGTEDPFAAATVVSPVTFGKNAKKMTATTGSPVSYIPPTSTSTTSRKSTPTASGTGSVANAESSNDSEDGRNKIIIGVSVGLGVPVLILIVAGAMYVFFCLLEESLVYLHLLTACIVFGIGADKPW
jgi:hypothetical protein